MSGKPRVLARGVKNTLPGAGLVRAAKGAQRHVLAAGETRVLCGIDTASWQEPLVQTDKLVTCPYCAKALKAPAKAAKEEAAGA